MLGKVAGVALILLPEFLSLHRVWGISPPFVPGLPVGVFGPGCGGGAGLSVLFMSFFLWLTFDVMSPRHCGEHEKEIELIMGG